MANIFELEQGTPELTIRQMFEVYFNDVVRNRNVTNIEDIKESLFSLIGHLNTSARLFLDEENRTFIEEQKRSLQKEFCDLFSPNIFIDHLMIYMHQYLGQTVPTTQPQFYLKQSALLTDLIQWMQKENYIHQYSMKYLEEEINRWMTFMVESIECSKRLNEYFYRPISEEDRQHVQIVEEIFTIENTFMDTLILHDPKQQSYNIRLPILLAERMKIFLGKKISAQLEQDTQSQNHYYRFLLVGRIFSTLPDSIKTVS